MFPIIFEHSKVPKFISIFAPFEVGGFAFFIFVWLRHSATPTLVMHERIHFLQQKEMGFLPQWICYGLFFIVLYFWHGRDALRAYRKLPFELESYEHQFDMTYPTHRKRYAWTRYVKKAFARD